jgi:hypothetical protein
MGSVTLNGATSGQITLSPPAVAGTNTITLPAVTDTAVTLAATQTLTNKTLTSPTITGASVSAMASSVITSGTSQASTSGTSIDFTSIPSWVKRITVMFQGVSTSGTSNLQVQIGSGSVTTSGYQSLANSFNTTPSGTSATSGFLLTTSTSAASLWSGCFSICNLTSNSWVVSGTLVRSDQVILTIFGGNITLGGTLDRVRITTVNGTDTFDAGTINIMYE